MIVMLFCEAWCCDVFGVCVFSRVLCLRVVAVHVACAIVVAVGGPVRCDVFVEMLWWCVCRCRLC